LALIESPEELKGAPGREPRDNTGVEGRGAKPPTRGRIQAKARIPPAQ